MSKSTKIIAALGVVAGLGVAALPMAGYAATVNGDALVKVTVDPAISIQIKGNTASNTDTVNKWSPSGSFGVDTSMTEGPASSSVSLTQNSKVEGGSGSATDFKSNIVIHTNNKSGYELTVAPAESESGNTSLKSGQDTIAAISEAGDLTAGIAGGAWGLKAGGSYGDGVEIKNDKWYPITADTQKVAVKGTASAADNGDEYDVLYGVATSATQATGTYQITLTYTATTK